MSNIAKAGVRNRTNYINIMAVCVVTLFATICFSAFSVSAIGSVQKEENQRHILKKVSSLQIPFIENQGQIEHAGVKYYAKTMGGTLFITKDGEMVYSFPLYVNQKSEIPLSGTSKTALHMRGNPKCQGWTIKESFVGASTSNVKGEENAITKVSYFRENDPARWRRNIPTFNIVNLGEIYNGVVLKLKAYGNNVEKLFYVKPGTAPKTIKVRIEGSKDLKVNRKGELEVETGLGVVKFTKPVAYQEGGGKRKHVDVAYNVNGNEYGFKVGDYDETKELVIDPLLASTLLGGGNLDDVNSMTIDSSGSVYVVGVTQSSNFPTTLGAYDTGYNGFQAVFISKLDTNLQNLLASTFLGGTGNDDDHDANSISLDISGNVYVTGWTNSSSFPTTPGAYDRTFNGYGQGFVSKIDSNLQNLLASTFLGGGNNIDIPRSIIIDGVGTVYVTGHANSSDFPTIPGAYQTTHSGGFHSADVFVSRLDASLQNLLASTFLGSTNSDYPSSICLDNGGNVYVAGHTASSDFPTTSGAYDTGHNGGGYYSADAFVSKLDGNLQNLLASTFLGGVGDDFAESMSIIGGNVYVAGNAGSSDFPTTPGAYDTTRTGAFVSNLDSNLQNLCASTFLGGGDAESISIIGGNVYVAGYAFSDFPTTPGAYDTTYNGSGDAFVSKLDDDLQSLLASTFLGSSGQDHCCCVTTDSIGNIYIAGFTTSPNFPSTPAAYDTTFNGFSDGFVSKLDSDLSALLPDISISPTIHNFGAVDVASTSKQTFTVSNTGNGELVVGTLSITGTDESEFNLQNDNCSQRSIAPSGHCTVDVVFSPVLKGPKTANLCVPSDDLDTPTLDVPLSGIGSGEAKIIYVNDDATCPGDGTQENPFCNLRDGVNAADHDDTVYVMAGTYEIDVLPAHSWDANPIVIEKNITLSGENPNTTIIKSLSYGENSGSYEYPLRIWLLEIRANVVVEGFTFDIPNPVQDHEKQIFVEDVTGIQAYTNTGNITIQNNIFKVGRYSSNSDEWGYVRAIYLYCNDTGSGTIKNNQFLGEYQQGSYVTPIGFRFYYSHDSSINISNNIFCKFRWGMLMNGPETGSANTVIINNTLDQNDVAIHLWWRGTSCNLGTLRNNIITSNGFGVQVSAGEEINLSDYLHYDHNDYSENEYNIALKLGSSGPYLNTALGTGSIEADPLYVGNGDYHLTAYSPCIDAGSSDGAPVDDIDGETRSDGGDIDMGADEYIDSDSDNLPDYWEYYWFGNLAQSSTGDPDFDGVINFEEYQDRTNPNEPFCFVDQTYGNDANNGLTWAAAKATIQAGINLIDFLATKEQGRVFVAAGTYVENIIHAPNVELIGGYPAGGGRKDVFANVTTIDGGGNGHAVIISDGDGIRIDGFAIKGGNASGTYPSNSGGGIYCSGDGNSPVIINCTIKENSADNGGGIYLGNSSPLIKNCIISGNSANDNGGGIYSNAEASSTIVNCMMYENTAGLGGGIYAAGDSTITNSSIADNTAGNAGGGIYCDTSVEPTVTNCIVWGNSPEQISAISPVVTFSCIQDGYPGEGNFDSNPRFVDPGNGNYHLAGDSPCINAGTDEGSPVDDIDNEGRPNRYYVDIGCDEYYGIYIDADSDNLPDYWEYYWFGNLSQDGTSDSDFDGVINFEEYQNDTDPNELAGGVIFVSDDYGDDANDGHDCSHAKKSIQAAIDAVVDEAVVYVMNGTYEIDVLGPIVVDKNITLKGEDPDTTIIKSVPFAENTGPVSICLMKIERDVILHGFTFDLPNPLTDYGENIFVDEVCGICAEDISNKNITIKNIIFKVGRYSTNQEEEGDVIGIKLKGFEEATITIKNNQFSGEYLQDDYVKPVGIYLWPYYNYSNYQIEVSNNILSKLESGIYMRTPPSGVSDLIIINNTLDQNDVAISLLSWGEGSLGTARNNIMSNNSIGIGVPSSHPGINLPEYLTYDHNGYFNNTIDITVTDPMWEPYSYPSLGTEHITENPLYVGNGDYHLREDSPCKDAGSSEGAPGDDIDNEVRPYGDNLDIGADEYRPDPVLASLVAYYPFDQNADDASGNGYDGSVYGATLIGGYYAQAYAFDGNGDYISVPVDINPGVMPQMTMGAWVKADSEISICQFISHGDGDYDRSLGIENPGAGMEWSAFSGSGEVLGYHPVEPDKWTFVAVAYDQDMSSVMLYVDGYAYYGTGTLGPGLNYLHIGSNPTSGGYFQGIIDDVFILDQAFTRKELNDIRENGILISPPDLSDFAAEFGRTDCSGNCKCDFDTDGDVDGSDLAVFSENLGQEGQ